MSQALLPHIITFPRLSINTQQQNNGNYNNINIVACHIILVVFIWCKFSYIIIFCKINVTFFMRKYDKNE